MEKTLYFEAYMSCSFNFVNLALHIRLQNHGSLHHLLMRSFDILYVVASGSHAGF